MPESWPGRGIRWIWDASYSESAWHWLPWHAAATVAVAMLASQAGYGQAIWSLPAPYLRFVSLLAVLYACAALASVAATRLLPASPRWLVRVAAVSSIFAVFYLALLVVLPQYSRAAMLASLVASVALLSGPWPRARVAAGVRASVLALPLLGLVGVGLISHNGAREAASSPKVETRHIDTALMYFRLEKHPGAIPSKAIGGALAVSPQGLIAVSGDGRIFRIERNAPGQPVVSTEFETTVPINLDEFAEDTPASLQLDGNGMRAGAAVWSRTPEMPGLIVSHHYWHREEQCAVMRISLLPMADGAATGDWRTIYETHPCIGLKQGDSFNGQQLGGRLDYVDDATLIVTVGDHGFDGVRGEAYPQRPGNDYGKTLLVDVASGEATEFTSGHRNAQGLYVDADRNIWLTEHGPQGGDELNLLSRGSDYGWPSVSLGTDYGTKAWPLSERHGRHEGYAEPIYAFVPSIAIASVIRVEESALPEWEDDLLITSLRAETLYRVRVRDGRAVVTEPIEIGGRLRDIVQVSPESFAIYFDQTETVGFLDRMSSVDDPSLFAGDDLAWGAALFSRCSGCHTFGDGTTHRLGPDLRNVFGRPIAGVAGFDFSPGLKAVGGAWSEERMDQFLESPAAFAPGTRMEAAGLADPAAREALVGYLKVHAQVAK